MLTAKTYFILCRTKLNCIRLVLRTDTKDSLVISRVTPLERALIRTGSKVGYDILDARLQKFFGAHELEGFVVIGYPTDNPKDTAFIFSASALPANHKTTQEIRMVVDVVLKAYNANNDNSTNARP